MRLLCILAMCFAWAMPAQAEKRVALVIGNSAYVHAPVLKNPRNDAEAISKTLEGLSFEVVKGIDLDTSGMQTTIASFADRLRTADVALLFYAGHGLQVNGTNYLVPIDGQLRNEIDLQFQSIKLDFLLSLMESPQRTSIVLLDACRDNPLAESLARSLGTRSGGVGRGLARVETGIGTYIGFSTQPGNVALDGDGKNSPFATALLKNLGREGLDIEAMMRMVRAEVMEETKNQQIPWGNSSLVGDGFVFRDAPQEPIAAEPKTTDNAAEIAYWESVKDSTDATYFEAYLAQYPEGVFAPLARLKITAIEKVLATERQALDAQKAEQERLAREAAAEAVAREKATLAEAAEAEKRAAELKAADEARRAAEAAEAARLDEEKRQAALEAEEKARADAERQKLEELAAAKAKADEEARKAAEAAETARLEEEKRQAALEAEEKARADAERQKLEELAAAKAKADEEARKAAEAAETARLEEEKRQAALEAEEKTRAEAERQKQEELAAAKAKADEEARKAAEAEAKLKEEADSQKEIEIARLEQTPTIEKETDLAPVDPAELALAIQKELARVGCLSRKVDGKWGSGSERSLGDFAKRRGVKLASLTPSAAVLEQLKGASGRVCPLVCGKGLEERKGRCEKVKREASVQPKPPLQKTVNPKASPEKVQPKTARIENGRQCMVCVGSGGAGTFTICKKPSQTWYDVGIGQISDCKLR
jgi:uncharacterized caspase-like protein